MNVGIIAITIKTKRQEISVYNLPNTQWFVSNNSNVPCFFHPKKLRIVTTGIKNIKIQVPR
jgi:hypothetical protein